MKKRNISAMVFAAGFGLAFVVSFFGYALGAGAEEEYNYNENTVAATKNATNIPNAAQVQTNAADNVNVPDDVTWTYENGTLLLTGTGRMDNFDLGQTPWASYNSQINYISIGDGITYIGTNAFAETSATAASIPNSILAIGNNAFAKKDDGTGNIVLYVTEGSYGQAYAEMNGFSYQISGSAETSLENGSNDPNAIGGEDATETNTAQAAETDANGNIVVVPYAGVAEGGAIPQGIEIESATTSSNENPTETGEFESAETESETGETREYESAMGRDYNDTGINWNVRNNKLYISGAGNMDDYTDYKQAPWADKYAAVTSVIIEDNVTSIGTHAFAQNKNLKSVSIPSTVYSIGSNAFYNCSSFKEATVPSSVLTIGKHALGYKYNSKTKKAEKITDFTIIGERGSAAEKYAKENKFKFVTRIVADGPVRGAASSQKAYTPSFKTRLAICLFVSIIFAVIVTFIYYVWQRNGGLSSLLKKHSSIRNKNTEEKTL